MSPYFIATPSGSLEAISQSWDSVEGKLGGLRENVDLLNPLTALNQAGANRNFHIVFQRLESLESRINGLGCGIELLLWKIEVLLES
ncbi:hypothetical protein Pst134EA_023027 [Puccinia striiformis f. sp. tritici]|uniref:hypothetical protein n=1 Tax=Puccinia striiformis f. sp. tritici TaxID=168172 RepID=UPI000A12913D|nr:hypothetical protein Pst134EA_023027 [Puccinia striiformis f. sp. tritici]KAH9455568.1 hypothetical protein Pst134EA_023027 [Puccinia striiformis f. sp. tritici]KAI9612333.1 hypothetical protein KEM48_004214 [Puccinia striiformis f. sp. tritici PST-130]